MAVKADSWIRKMAQEKGMIQPFVEKQVRQGVVSYGLSSYGYDFRVADEFRVPVGAHATVIDPKAPRLDTFESVQADHVIIPPNSFVLARSVETFRIPREIITICYGKSTYARCGVVVNVTPFEPEWEGMATLEISNTAPRPAKLYANEGIAQLLFLESDTVCEVSYADKKGKYQKQVEVTPPRL